MARIKNPINASIESSPHAGTAKAKMKKKMATQKQAAARKMCTSSLMMSP
jgi:hypothetical protein